MSQFFSLRRLFALQVSMLLVVVAAPALAGPITTNRLLWFQADAITGLNDDDPVSTWNDSHGANDATGAGATRPTFQSDVVSLVNGLPVVRFDGSDDRLDTPSVSPGSDEATVFAVAKVSATTSYGEFVTYGTNAAGSWNLRQVASTGRLSLANGASNLGAGASGVATAAGTTATLVGQGFKILEGSFTAANAFSIWENGTLMHSATETFTQAASNIVVLGNRGDNLTALNGDMAEVIVYSRALNSAERIVVENYLGAKWDLPVAIDRYQGKTIGNGNYDRQVFGIAQEVDGNTTLGTFANGLTLAELNGSLDDGESVLAGHKSATNGFVPGTEPGTSRWERVWYLDGTSTDGVDVSLTFDFSEGGVALPALAVFEEYVLLYSPTDPFSFSTIAKATSQTGDMVTFELLSAGLFDGYYTLGIGLIAVPEPSTFVLLAGGIATLVVRGRRCGRQTSRAQA